MRKGEVARGPHGRVIVVDSITQLDAGDAGAVVVSGSHGGTSSAEFALALPLRLVFFNDAGVGKDSAGIAALALLQARGVPAAGVAHSSARIGDALDAWENGVISHANLAARGLGVQVGQPVSVAAQSLLD
ncbi:MAG TPA: hypothetical protein VLE94_01430 [Burkholderiaceae bacterium]|nr:hypothetical protein [Burkholderiaceae bacterium]HSC00315.1 hypothetical protein [Burkholderiaceae bacterium]